MDPYKVLGLDRSCSMGDVKKAYMKLAKTVHPDKGGNEEEFKKINAAYMVLNDEEKRHFYDMTGQMPGEEGRPNVHEVHVGGGGPGMPFPFPFDVGQMFGMFNNGMPPGMRGGSSSQTQRKEESIAS